MKLTSLKSRTKEKAKKVKKNRLKKKPKKKKMSKSIPRILKNLNLLFLYVMFDDNLITIKNSFKILVKYKSKRKLKILTSDIFE